MPRDGYHEMKTLDMDEQGLPMHVHKTIQNMPTEWQHRLEDFGGSQRRESRLQHRAEMERQAEFGAALTCKLYFEGLKEGKQTDDHRLSRKHKEKTDQRRRRESLFCCTLSLSRGNRPKETPREP